MKDADTIISRRGNGYQDPQDLIYKVNLKTEVIKLLIKGNCFHSFDKNRRALLWNIQNTDAKKPLALLTNNPEEDYFPKKEVTLPKMTTGENLILDYQSLKLSLSTHPVKLLRPFIKKDFIKEYCG